MRAEQFRWTTNDELDDWTGMWTGINRTIMLRAEKMDKNYWWCCAYLNKQQIFDGSARTEAGAKRVALIGLNKHLKQNF